MLLDGLNDNQRTAVTAPPGPVLVLAGPGSGKTRVLTHRIAHLVQAQGVPSWSIMAVTFTNKAAGEMLARVERIVGGRLRGTRIGTFHAICARLLREQAESLPQHDRNYLIYDTDDQLSVVKIVVEELGVNLKRHNLNPYKVLNRISDAKNELIAPENFASMDYVDEIIARMYLRYQAILADSNAMDFDDLIMNTVTLLRDERSVRDKYQTQFEHVLVDEFQDTNMAQYELIKLLTAPQNNVFVVGDEDQAIYGFRGADYRNVARFRRDYPHAQVTLLEQNYRSTQIVLDAARAVIDRNANRTPKALFTDRGAGVQINGFEAYDEREEAEFIVAEIDKMRAAGNYNFSDVAVMYRTNNQSRALETAFRDNRVPYQLIGGIQFFGRRHIKDMLAYLRLLDNPNDTVSFNRIVNTPTRGIGAKTLAGFIDWANGQSLGPGEALVKVHEGAAISGLSNRASNSIAKFADLVVNWRAMLDNADYTSLLDDIIERTRYEDYLDGLSKTDTELQERKDDLTELRGSLANLEEDDTLSDFLTDAALLSSIDTREDEVDKVTLLTLHASKGLEYPVVFIIGLEDGLLPHIRSMDDPEGMAEERRLLYVGMTRARDKLYLTRAFRRATSAGYVNDPSRFLRDIPPHLIEGQSDPLNYDRTQQSYYRSTQWDAPPTPRFERGATRRSQHADDKIIQFPSTEAARPKPLQFEVGQRVLHGKFGEGMVIESKHNGSDEEVTVAFEGQGIKRLMASFANLVKLED